MDARLNVFTSFKAGSCLDHMRYLYFKCKEHVYTYMQMYKYIYVPHTLLTTSRPSRRQINPG
jgi:hypothetical protein